MRSILVILVVVLALLCVEVVSGDVGVGLWWDLSEIEGKAGDKICGQFGLYNPFDTDIIAYLDVSGELIDILEKGLSEKKRKHETILDQLSELRDKYRGELSEEEELETIEEIRKLESEQKVLEDYLNKIYEEQSVYIKAGTSSKDRIMKEICFYPTKRGIYDGEVIAKNFKTSGVASTGSSVSLGVSASLKVIALRKDINYRMIAIIVGIVVVLIVLGIWIKKKRNKTSM